jgi:hypothetical protein
MIFRVLIEFSQNPDIKQYLKEHKLLTFRILSVYKDQLTTSARERIAKPINFLNSGLDWPIDPSEMFNAIESTALLICEVRLYISSWGNLHDN